ncbi:MAG: hypothetical protein ABIP54_04520 [Candidatus Andersenbacteria bacterium]
MRTPVIFTALVSIAILAALGLFIYTQQQSAIITIRSTPSALPSSLTPTTSNTIASKTIFASDTPNTAKAFTYSAEVPISWQAEAVPAIEAIALYDPAAPGANNLEKSQIFIRHFSANDFLTLSTVTIHSRQSLTIGNRPAVRYDIEKKADITNFPHQPIWRNLRHVVTDVRLSNASPSTFYVIAKNPTLSDAVYQQFLQTLK